MNLRILAAVLLATFLPFKAYAWGADGHRIVCAIAWNELSPAARSKVEELLHAQGRDAFAESCLWADQHDAGSPRDTAGWHTVAVPAGAQSVNVLRDCAGEKSCVVFQIGASMLKLTDPKATPDERAVALKYVSHFVGDVHQPLNVGRAEDKQGSAIKGQFFGAPTDFHAVWDSGILHAQPLEWQALAEQLAHGISTKQRRNWNASQPIDWANESLAIANDPGTGYVDQPFNLGKQYERTELPVVYDRLSRAGVRLGAMLNLALAGKY